jgi:hypothetical protein
MNFTEGAVTGSYASSSTVKYSIDKSSLQLKPKSKITVANSGCHFVETVEVYAELHVTQRYALY